MLRKMGLDPKSVDPSEVRKDYESMLSRKLQLEKTYKSAEKETETLKQKMANVEQYIGYDKMHNTEKIRESAPEQDQQHKPFQL